LIPEKDMLELVVKRSFPSYGFHMHTGDRKVHYYKSYGSVSVNIFEGKHEQIVKSVLALLPVKLKRPDKHKNILCIGDSNGEIAEGWVNQLRFELPYSTIINKCKSGNTIGFDNHGDTSLNELKTIHTHLKSAVQQINNQQFDYIIISLGTNDAKEQFAKSQKQIVRNLELLIQKIKNSDWAQVNNAKIIILSPPPIADDKNQPPRILEKFKGSRQRLEKLVSKFDAAAKKNNCVFVNSYQQLSDKWAEYSYDGIHYKANGARMAARALGLIAQ
jgi:lysophospholipase L1-like esterase